MTPAAEVSFELFPPADDAGAAQLAAAVERLAPLAPRYLSVTHGAAGSSRTRTRDWVRGVRGRWGLPVVPHLACVDDGRGALRALARDYWRDGFRRVIALRGDRPAGGRGIRAPRGYRFASDWVADLLAVHDFEVLVAAYPEGHPDTGTVEADVRNLARKADAGASGAITQFFFETDAFLRYRDRCRAAGVRIPIVPGILPIRRFEQVLRFAARCGASVPAWLRCRFDGLAPDGDAARAVAAEVAIAQVLRLRAHGVRQFHFYALNRADLCLEICEALGLRAGAAPRG